MVAKLMALSRLAGRRTSGPTWRTAIARPLFVADAQCEPVLKLPFAGAKLRSPSEDLKRKGRCETFSF